MPLNSTVFTVAVAVLLAALAVIVISQVGLLYYLSRTTRAGVRFWHIVMMRLRKVNAREVVFERIRSLEAGLDISPERLETHLLAGGDIRKVISAMIAAEQAGIDLSWQKATAIDLAGPGLYAEAGIPEDTAEERQARPPSRVAR